MKIIGTFLTLAILVSAQGLLTQVGAISPFAPPPDGIPAIYAQLPGADGIANDAQGNIYVSLASSIRRIDAQTGTISTIAGTGSSSQGTEEGPARQATVNRNFSVSFNGYGSIAFAPDGHLLFMSGTCLKRFDPSTNFVKVVSGPCSGSSSLNRIKGVVVASDGTVYVYQPSSVISGGGAAQAIYRVDVTTGALSLFAGGNLAGPSVDGSPALNAFIDVSRGVAVDSAQNVYFADSRRVRKVDVTTGLLTTVAGGGSSTQNGGLATQALLNDVRSIALNSAGDIFIGEPGRIRVVRKSTGIIDTFAGVDSNHIGFNGDDLPAKDSTISYPTAIIANGNDIFFIDSSSSSIPSNSISRARKVSGTTGSMTTIAGGVDSNGDGGLVSGATFNGVRSLVSDKAGNLFLTSGSTIRRIDKVTNIISTFAGGGFNSADGAIGKEASIQPSNLVFDSQNNLLFTDGGRIRKLDALARVSTVAGTISASFSGDGKLALQASFSLSMGDIVLDSRGNIIVADTGNCRVRRIDYLSTIVTTIAGNGDCVSQPVEGTATQSPIRPVDLAIGPNDELYISTGNNVWLLDSGGLLHAFAGNGFGGSSTGDGGDALAASFDAQEIMFDQGQNLVIVGDGRIRRIDKTTNIIQTVAGGGNQLVSNGTSSISAIVVIMSNLTVAIEDGNDLLLATTDNIYRVSPYTVPPLSQPPSLFVFRDPTNLQQSGVTQGSILSLTGNYLAPETAWGSVDETGRLAKSLNGVHVFFGNTPAPLLYVSPAIIHIVVPDPINGIATNVRLETPYGSQVIHPNVFDGNPGISIFPTPIFNPDGSPNSPFNPARSGDILTMFATNLGPLNPPVADGTIIRQAPGGSLPMFVRPVSAKVTNLSGSNPAAVVSAGPASGYVAGMARLSIRLPDGLSTGPVSLSAASTGMFGGPKFGQPVIVYVTSNAAIPKNPPEISSISPNTIDPFILQSIKITGIGFESGLYVRLYWNGTEDQIIPTSAIREITTTSFNADVLLRAAGTWEFEVVTPSGGRSSSKGVIVIPERRSGMPSDPGKLRQRN